ncbi:type III secretion effector protein [Pseudomonas nabeulensis]|uniref:Type III secretion effector protein n=2 Tax=Pseudomonas nabeulensis TaxID=2293833 RepID=A0A4Z0B528_9PSED|nr:type III secretion effector protein [Pseudomonas nabeulensis]
MASKAIIDRIEAHSEMPGAEKKNVDGTTSTRDPAATEQQKLEARLENAEIKTELMVNTILSLNEGPDAQAVGKDPNAATDADSRLKALESRMSGTEDQMKEIAKRYGLIYEPYAAPESSQTPTETSRMEVVEQRYAHMNKMVKRLIRNAEADAEGDE